MSSCDRITRCELVGLVLWSGVIVALVIAIGELR